MSTHDRQVVPQQSQELPADPHDPVTSTEHSNHIKYDVEFISSQLLVVCTLLMSMIYSTPQSTGKDKMLRLDDLFKDCNQPRQSSQGRDNLIVHFNLMIGSTIILLVVMVMYRLSQYKWYYVGYSHKYVMTIIELLILTVFCMIIATMMVLVQPFKWNMMLNLIYHTKNGCVLLRDTCDHDEVCELLKEIESNQDTVVFASVPSIFVAISIPVWPWLFYCCKKACSRG